MKIILLKMNILNQNESFRSLININLDGIKSVLVKNCIELEQDIKEIYIDKRFTFEIINSFNERQINTENINDIIELCNYLQIEETVKFIINNCEPSDNYKIDKKYSFIENFKIENHENGHVIPSNSKMKEIVRLYIS